MKPLAMRVQGFRSFAEPMEFKFPDAAGLFLIRGKNKLQPTLGANGAGKSSFWAALCWCFYGKTERGLAGSHVESWVDCEATEVSTDVEIDGRKATILRGRDPIRLLLDDVAVTQDVIDDLLGMNYDRFLQVALMGQFGTMFADMKPTARLDLVSQVLDLDLWSKAADRATTELRACEEAVRETEVKIAVLSVSASTLRRQLDNVKEDAATWRKKQDEKIETATVNLNAARKKVTSLGDSATDLEKFDRQMQRKHKDAITAVTEAEHNFGDLDDGEMRSAYAKVIVKLEAAEEEREAMEALGSTCNVCRQSVTDEHHTKLRKQTAAAIRKLTQERDEAAATLDASKKQRDELKRLVSDARVELVAAGAAAQKSDRKYREALLAEQSLQEGIDLAESALVLIGREKNPHADRAEALEDDIGRADLALTEAEAGHVDEIESVRALAPWPKRFKELRLWVVEGALEELAVNVNSSMIELGLRGWKIEFRVERETQSGGISRGFEILVYAPTVPDGAPSKGIPWEAWSGGETQRLRIACAVGLATMIRSRMPDAPVFEVWDEPTAHLNVEGVRDLVAFFGSRADDRQVWLVDHRSLDSGQFDAAWTVVKDRKGSHLTAG